MAADLTRDDLARLNALIAEWEAALSAVDAAQAHEWAAANTRWQAVRENLRVALYDSALGLLAAAERDLDRREGLVFGPEYADVRHAVAADGVVYVLRGSAVYGWGFWLLYATARAPIKAYATEAEAIDAARAHDKARRGGK